MSLEPEYVAQILASEWQDKVNALTAPPSENGAGPAPVIASSWAPVNLAPIVAGIQAGEIVGPVPELMPRTDGVCLLYPGEIHSLAGEPETCKGWIVLDAVRSVIAAGNTALYLDFEDAPASIITRLIALGATKEQILEHFTYVRPVEAMSGDTFGALLDARPFTLAIVDGLSEAYALLGCDINSNNDAARFLAAVPRPLADQGAAVIEIDHVGRVREQRGRNPIGAQHKLAGVAVAYSTEMVDEPSRTSAGLVKLKVAKDRHGHVRGHAQGKTIAEVRVTPCDDGESVSVVLTPAAGGEGEQFRPTRLMERVSRAVEQEPGINSSAIREIEGKNDTVSLARNSSSMRNTSRRERTAGPSCTTRSDRSGRTPNDPSRRCPHVVPTLSPRGRGRRCPHCPLP